MLQATGLWQYLSDKQQLSDPGWHSSHPDVYGVEIKVPWSKIQPASRTVYDWSSIDNLLAIWGAAGKKLRLFTRTSPGGLKQHDDVDGTIPQWAWDLGILYALSLRLLDGVPNPQKLVCVWDPTYLEVFGEFVQAMGARYDGHPDLGEVVIGPGAFVSTKPIYPSQNSAMTLAGFTPGKWYRGLLKLCTIYRRAFRSTPLSLCVAPFISYDAWPGSGVDDPVWNAPALAKRVAGCRRIGCFYHNLRGTAAWGTSTWPIVQGLATLGSVSLGMDNPTCGSDALRIKYGTPAECITAAWNLGPHITGVTWYGNDVEAATVGAASYDQRYADAAHEIAVRLQS